MDDRLVFQFISFRRMRTMIEMVNKMVAKPDSDKIGMTVAIIRTLSQLVTAKKSVAENRRLR